MTALKVVLTGGPYAGKTTLARFFASLGFEVVPEAAEIVLKRRKEWDDALELQLAIFDLQIKLESRARLDREVVFYDRGIPDGIAYLRIAGKPIPSWIWELCPGRYDKVFLLERLPFKRGGIRRESGDEEAERIEKEIERAYKELGYRVEWVPLLPVGERARLVLEKLGLFR